MYKTILVPIDGSDTSARAFDTALQLARDNNAELRPVYVIDNPLVAYDAPGYDPSILRDAMCEEGKRVTDAALAKMHLEKVRGIARIDEVELSVDSIADRILKMATEMHADLVVMGTHGRRGFRRLVLGSVAERFVRIASCPVLLVPSHQALAPADESTRDHSA
jgi:nucleotide-binding universal stress UspA family protein